ncbi:MAG: hypothetical protein WC205_19170 [Opitutaceae bacterium]
MIRALLTFLRFLRIPTFIRGQGDRRRMPTTPVRNGKFASFMSVQGSNQSYLSDRYDRRLRFQKLTRVATFLAATAGFAWVAIESAQALSFF